MTQNQLFNLTLPLDRYTQNLTYPRKYKRLLKQDKEENKNKYRKIAKTEVSVFNAIHKKLLL